MVIKVEIELDEMWSDGESTLSEEIQHSIKLDVKQQILADIKTTTQIAITEAVSKSIEEGLDAKVQSFMDEAYNNNEFLVKQYGRDNELTMKSLFEGSLRNIFKNSDVHRFVKRQLDDSYVELKRRYDLEFASQFLSKLRDNNMLSESGKNLLLPSDDSA